MQREMMVQTAREKIGGSTIPKFRVPKVDAVDLRMFIAPTQPLYTISFVHVNTKTGLG